MAAAFASGAAHGSGLCGRAIAFLLPSQHPLRRRAPWRLTLLFWRACTTHTHLIRTACGCQPAVVGRDRCRSRAAHRRCRADAGSTSAPAQHGCPPQDRRRPAASMPPAWFLVAAKK
eukprot:7383170-Prymnesium_polylepis.1